MDIRVSGHQVETGNALQTHVTDRLQGIADKYFSKAIAAHATFGRGPRDHGFSCDVVAHVMQGVVLKATGQAMEAHPAFDVAAEKMEKQLRRYVRRLHDKNGASIRSFDANYVLFEEAPEEEPEGDAPPIIAETRVDVPEASVSDAVMMLDLRNTNALLFLNAGTGTYNMVYRRGDGTIGWVEPQRA